MAWCHSTSDCRVASQPTHTSLWLGAHSGLPDPRPGCLLWQSVRSAGSVPRHSRSSDVTAFALAEWLCGAPDRFDPPGMSRPCCGVRRAAPAAFAAVLHGLLQHCSNAPVAVEGRAYPAPCARSRTYPATAPPRWIASSLCPDLICGRDRVHFAAAVSLILGRSRLAGVYCACRTATGRTSNKSDAASVGPVITLPPASTLLIAEKPSVATDAFQAPPAGHLLPLSVARPKRRPVTTITAFRPLNRAKATISLRCGPVIASGR